MTFGRQIQEINRLWKEILIFWKFNIFEFFHEDFL